MKTPCNPFVCSVLASLACLAAPILLSSASAAQSDDLLVVEAPGERGARNQLLARLANIRVTVHWNDASAKEVAQFLQSASGKSMNVVVSSRTVKPEAMPRVTMTLKNITVKNLMALVQDQTDLRFTYQSGVVFLKPKDEVKARTFLRMYDVRAAVMPVKNFKPRYKLGLRVNEEEAGVGVDDEEAKPLLFDADRLVELVRGNAAKDSWDRPGVSIDSLNGILLVRQSVRGHREVRDLLVQLGAIPPTLRVVARRVPTKLGSSVKPKAPRKPAKDDKRVVR
ncbi:MAG: hypothetical protein KDC87_11570 [Planctomycetes bacterium]|nr:hypothetical protein [Planctomycetota bacterium]MCB9870206.1 hypothetical protein [Planctomycetota bacterium]